MILTDHARVVLRHLLTPVLDCHNYPKADAVSKIASASNTDGSDIYYAIKRLRMLSLEPTPNVSALLPSSVDTI